MPASRRATLIASPMPLVPPVTIATRAMPLLSCFCRARPLRAAQPTFKLAPQNAAQHFDARRAVVEAAKIGGIGAARLDEGVAAADRKLLERLEAVGREAGGHHRDLRHAALRPAGGRGDGRRLPASGAAGARAG